MSDKSANVIVSLIGVAGLLLYFYLLVMGDIAPENQKYTVIAASAGLLYPAISLFESEDVKLYGWKALGVGLVGLCIILISGFAIKVQTSEGVIWDFLVAVTTKGWLYFYLVILIVANLCPLALKRYSIWVIPFVIGIMVPVVIATLLLLAIIIGGLSLLGLFGKSDKTTNSWSSILSSSSCNSNNGSSQTSIKQNITKKVDNRRYAWIKIEYARDEYDAINAIGYYKAKEALPTDFTNEKISKFLKKKYGLGYDPIIVKTEIDIYTDKDSVQPLAFKI